MMKRLQQRLSGLRRNPFISGKSCGTILMYHSIGQPASDPWGLAVSPTHFAEQLALIQQKMNPLSLVDFLSRKQANKLPSRAVVLTFDDGYLDNLHTALPLLERYDIPATVFIPTGYLGQMRAFWWDELARILLHTDHLPRTLTLCFGIDSHSWELKEMVDYPPVLQEQYAGWTAYHEPPTQRQKLYLDIWQKLYAVDETERWRILLQIQEWAGLEPEAQPMRRPVNNHELRLLNDSPLISIGAHTVTHAPLPTLSHKDQLAEIQHGKRTLETLIDAPVTLFSYPHGAFNRQTSKLVRQSNFAAACTVIADSVRRRDNRFLLPRFQVWNWNEEQFHRFLNHSPGQY